MKVIKIKDMVRNDCNMDLKCEHCGHEQEEMYAYNDRHYTHTVVPKERYCDNCKKNTFGEEKPIPIQDDLQNVKFGQEK